MKNKLEYIASGVSFTRITQKEVFAHPPTHTFINSAFDVLNSHYKSHTFSLLYNAFSESSFGEILANYKDHINEIMVDSGGLQMVTCGENITSELKTKVYKNQGEFGTTALSFDEIPVIVKGESSRNDYTSRFFDEDNFDDYAKATGKNVATQIQTFLDMKSNTKPIFIAQGNCLDTYCRWTELALGEIPKEHHQYIDGVAMGAAALGPGQLEDIQRAFYFTQLPIETGRLHLLGVGSAVRLIPNLIFAQAGIYGDTKISYDSTSHSSACEFGNFYHNRRTNLIGRKFDAILYTKVLNIIQNGPFRIEGLTLDDFYWIMNNPMGSSTEKYGDKTKFIQVKVAMFASSVFNFMEHVDFLTQKKSNVLASIKNKKIKSTMESLYTINTIKDFKYWEKHISRYVNSKRISSISKNNSMTMEDFF